MTGLAEGLVRRGLRKTDVDRVLDPCLNDGIVDHLDGLRLNWLMPLTDPTDDAAEAIRLAVNDDDALKDAVRRIRILLRAMRPLRKAQRRLNRILNIIEHSDSKELLDKIDRLALRYEAKFFWRCKAQTLSHFIVGALGLTKQAREIYEAADLLRKVGQDL